MGVPLFLFTIPKDEIYIGDFNYALFYAWILWLIMLFYLFLFYILHKNETTDTIQTSNKYSIKVLNIHH